jgi:hypothetical protein
MLYTIETLKEMLISQGYDNLKEISSRKLAVLTDQNRVDVLKDIVKKIKKSKFFDIPTSASSVGYVEVEGNLKIFVKPLSKQGSASAGIDNENIVVDTINSYTKKGPINVIFKDADGRKTFDVYGCTSASSVGSDTTDKKKADIILYVGNTKYPISIKKDNAEYWESADTSFGPKSLPIIKKAIKDKKIKLIDNGSYFTIEPNIAVKATKEEKNSIIFGSDILTNKGCVITKTFSKDSFNLEDGNLIIDVSNIITNLTEVPDDKDVFFLIRNDKTRKSVKEYPGIRVLAAYKSRINKNVLVLPRK